MQPIRIEITPVVVEADEHTQSQRADVAQRLENLGHITAADGRVNTTVTAGWQATVNGTAMPLAGFAVEPDGERVLVSLMVVTDAVSVDRSPTATPAPAAAVQERPTKRRVWGDPSTPDPRESIPGWNPAHESSTAGHDHTLANWTCGCDPILVGIQEAARKTSNIDLHVGSTGSLGAQVARNAELTA